MSSSVSREKLDNREGQTDSASVDEHLLVLQKTFDVTLIFSKAHIYDYRGARCLQVDYHLCTLVALLCHLNSH